MKIFKYTRELVIAGVIILTGLIIIALWLATDAVPRDVLRGWAVIVTLIIAPGFFAGFYFGKIEARGMLHGFDRSLDRMTNVVRDVMTVRDQSRIAVHNATRPAPANYQVVLPGVRDLPQITARATRTDDVVEL